MSYGSPEHTDVMVVVEIQKLITGELGVVVRDDAVRYPKAMDNVGEKQHDLFRPDASNGEDLDPLGKLVNGDEQVGEALSCSLQGFDQVEPPNSKWPCNRNGL
jgi:hypothetical protein